ncbi:MAG: TetR family transcriptional regulator [Dactylosporangium sp.]|nr:TetR/AcrR family transcriptional regulator C-terminal domain-containing protein [Dactylosporangium sp.]NNJ62639.1 TetR family transcriptional regulator [Dactylosporangium sp.]
MSPRRASHPKLTREQIVSAAMRLIDDFGMEGYSMRRLGAELGIDASTIYYHVPGKTALDDLIVDEIMGSIDLTVDDASKSFQDRVVDAGRRYRRALLRHPKAMPLVAVRPLRTPAQLHVVETLAQIFLDAGFRPIEAFAALDICGMTILGMTNMHAASLVRAEPAGNPADLESAAGGRDSDVTRLLARHGRLDAELEFEWAMRATAIGLLAMHETGALAPDADTKASRPPESQDPDEDQP